MKALFRTHPYAATGFVLATAVTLFFLVRIVVSAIYRKRTGRLGPWPHGRGRSDAGLWLLAFHRPAKPHPLANLEPPCPVSNLSIWLTEIGKALLFNDKNRCRLRRHLRQAAMALASFGSCARFSSAFRGSP